MAIALRRVWWRAAISLSLRGSRGCRLTWQSRGSALSKKGGIVVSIWKYGADLRLRHCSTTLGGAPTDLLARYSRFAVTATPTIASLLPHRERLMLASRRAINQCRVIFPAAPSFRCRCVATTRFQPFGKGKTSSPTPQGQRTLLHIGSIEIHLLKNKVNLQ